MASCKGPLGPVTGYDAGTGLKLNGLIFSLDTTFTDARYVLKSSAGGGLTVVETDATLSGDGTFGAPLALADDAVNSDKIADEAVQPEHI